MSTTSSTTASTTTTAPTITLDEVGKSYGGTSVLRDISLSIRPGEIHGLLGENGAGKSTLLKILGGVVSADAGNVTFDGKRVKVGSPRDAIDLGVSLIAQELALVPHRSVLENIFLGSWSNTAGIVRSQPDRLRAERLIAEVGFDLDLDAPVSSLALGQAQQVEIIKALARGSKILCLDEPTAALGEADTENLLRVIKNLATAGTTVIIVSHFLDEILGLADRITVLRDGNQITTDDASGYSADQIVSLMVGRQVEALSQTPEPVTANAPVVIKAENLTNSRIRGISFEVRAGEIVGLAGLMGAGRSETLNAVFGADRLRAGKISVDGKSVRTGSIRAAIKAKMALIPESRKEQGLMLGAGVPDNIALPSLGKRQWLGIVNRNRESSVVRKAVAAVDIRGQVMRVSAGDLSGGNQQKVLFAKWLVDPPRVLLVDEPTRGVDIAAKANIHNLILQLAARGTAVVVASSELEEVRSLAHRLLVMRAGRVVAELDRSASADEIMTAAFM